MNLDDNVRNVVRVSRETVKSSGKQVCVITFINDTLCLASLISVTHPLSTNRNLINFKHCPLHIKEQIISQLLCHACWTTSASPARRFLRNDKTKLCHFAAPVTNSILITSGIEIPPIAQKSMQHFWPTPYLRRTALPFPCDGSTRVPVILN